MEEIAGGRALSSPVVSRRTAVIDGLARPGPQPLVTARLLATDIFHAYGSPEVRQITPDGQLRVRYIHGVDAQRRTWAERNGVGALGGDGGLSYRSLPGRPSCRSRLQAGSSITTVSARWCWSWAARWSISSLRIPM